jgi:hypothetical protein
MNRKTIIEPTSLKKCCCHARGATTLGKMTLRIMALAKMTLGIMAFGITLPTKTVKYSSQHNYINICTLSITMKMRQIA